MQKQLDSDRKIKRGKWEIFATAPNRKRSMIGFGLMFGNQFTVSGIRRIYSVIVGIDWVIAITDFFSPWNLYIDGLADLNESKAMSEADILCRVFW